MEDLNIIEVIVEEIATDQESTDKSSARLHHVWENAIPGERKAINEVLMCVCGWTYETLKDKSYILTE